MKTYDQNQIEKPLKHCLLCGRPWYMLADFCMECADPYELRKAQAKRVDLNGVEMDGP